MSIDAPGWAEHISLNNTVLSFTNPQPFNQPSLSSTITHLDCCAHCGSEVDVTELCLKEYPCLESIHIGSYSFPHILSVEVSHLPKLKQFVVEDHCFVHPATIVPENVCHVEDCHLLESISIGVVSFLHYSVFLLKREELDRSVMVRSVSSEVTLCRN